jgi:putative endonuclease
VGRSKDLKRRMTEHTRGKVFTTSRLLPIELIFYEAFYSKKDAIRRERYFKTSKGKSSLKQIIRNSIFDLPNTT